MVNSVLPALIAGNSVIIKPSPQTPLAAERFAAAFHKAGVPQDALQVIHLSPELTVKAVKHTLVDFVAFTGSVAGGRAVDIAAAEADDFKGVGLEVRRRPLASHWSTDMSCVHQLGGKDPAYVRADADLDYTVPELVDGNDDLSGCALHALIMLLVSTQAPSSIPDRAAVPSRSVSLNLHIFGKAHERRVQRIYVHESIFDDFVARFVELTKVALIMHGSNYNALTWQAEIQTWRPDRH